jgi:hypothetical protein
MSNKVLIKIMGGAAHVYEVPDGVEVEVRDYDIEGMDRTHIEILRDEDGEYYIQ